MNEAMPRRWTNLCKYKTEPPVLPLYAQMQSRSRNWMGIISNWTKLKEESSLGPLLSNASFSKKRKIDQIQEMLSKEDDNYKQKAVSKF